MTLLSIGDVSNVINGTGLEDLRLWSKAVHAVSQLDMVVLAKQCELKLGHKAGRQLMKRIVAELSKAKILGQVPSCVATNYTLPSPRLSLGELRRILLKFSYQERQLIVFALASGESLTHASFLQHKDVKIQSNINNWTSELRSFVAKIPRHITCPFVFWETDKRGHACAMVGFEARFRSVTKASWSVFAKLCDDLIPLDAEADGKEFATMFVLESIHAG